MCNTVCVVNKLLFRRRRRGESARAPPPRLHFSVLQHALVDPAENARVCDAQGVDEKLRRLVVPAVASELDGPLLVKVWLVPLHLVPQVLPHPFERQRHPRYRDVVHGVAAAVPELPVIDGVLGLAQKLQHFDVGRRGRQDERCLAELVGVVQRHPQTVRAILHDVQPSHVRRFVDHGIVADGPFQVVAPELHGPFNDAHVPFPRRFQTRVPAVVVGVSNVRAPVSD